MKIPKFAILIVALLISSSCARMLENEDSRFFSSENEWILDVMKNNYLFRDDMPSSVNKSLEPTLFFSSLLSKSQDKNKRGTSPYSRIELKEQQNKSINSDKRGYGIEFISYDMLDNTVVARVLYVIKNSPAERAGLKRGDFILQIDDVNLNGENIQSLHSGSGTMLSVSETLNSKEKIIKIGSSEGIDDKPLHLYKSFDWAGHKVAYVVYNHFTPGVGDDLTKDRSYDDELCAMSNVLHDEGVDEMVLDLRYNQGGQISSALLLSTIIAPSSALGKIFCTLKSVNNKIENYRFDESFIRNGKNLNLKRLYVLTTEFTASASELVINSLRPYMEVIIVGDVTEGKNVGSVAFKHSDYPHTLKPITCYVYNSQNKADYDNGLNPDYFFRDIQKYDKQYSLGEIQESMLKIALGLIDGSLTTQNRAAKGVKNIATGGVKEIKEMKATYRSKNSGIIIN